MSSRAIVSLGVWILAMVLAGTLTVGAALAFYVALTALCALVAAALSALSYRRAVRRELGDPYDEDEGGDEAAAPPRRPARPLSSSSLDFIPTAVKFELFTRHPREGGDPEFPK